jgi:hypothetical protein
MPHLKVSPKVSKTIGPAMEVSILYFSIGEVPDLIVMETREKK